MPINENWNENKGPCGRCGICDPGGYTPKPGIFNEDASVLFLGHTPGEKDGKEKSKRSRLRKKERGNTPLTKEGQADSFLNSNWSPGHKTMLKSMFGINHNPSYKTLKHPSESIYYTNIVKCPKLSGDPNDISANEADQRNSSAETNCPDYLEEELNLVQPEVIVIFGGDPFCVFNDYFELGLDIESKDTADLIGKNLPIQEYRIDYFEFPVVVIVAYHWARAASSASQHLNWVGGNGATDEYSRVSDEYYKEYIDKINGLTDETVVEN